MPLKNLTYRTLGAAEAVLTQRGYSRTGSKKGIADLWHIGSNTAWIAQQSSKPHCYFIRYGKADPRLPFDL